MLIGIHLFSGVHSVRSLLYAYIMIKFWEISKRLKKKNLAHFQKSNEDLNILKKYKRFRQLFQSSSLHKVFEKCQKYTYVIFQIFPLINHLIELIKSTPNDQVGPTSTRFMHGWLKKGPTN